MWQNDLKNRITRTGFYAMKMHVLTLSGQCVNFWVQTKSLPFHTFLLTTFTTM